MSQKSTLPAVRAESTESVQNLSLDFIPNLATQLGKIKSVPIAITFDNPRLDLQTNSFCADTMRIGNIILK